MRKEVATLKGKLEVEKTFRDGLLRTESFLQNRVTSAVNDVNTKVKSLERNQQSLEDQMNTVKESIESVLNILKTQSRTRSRSESSRRSRRSWDDEPPE